jgi:uncharacterized protein YkvS
VATFHVALEGEDGRIALVPYTADAAPAVGETITFEGGAQGVVERVSEIEDVPLYHVRRLA